MKPPKGLRHPRPHQQALLRHHIPAVDRVASPHFKRRPQPIVRPEREVPARRNRRIPSVIENPVYVPVAAPKNESSSPCVAVGVARPCASAVPAAIIASPAHPSRIPIVLIPIRRPVPLQPAYSTVTDFARFRG